MNVLKALIIDDELHGRKNLTQLLKDYFPEVKVTGTASSSLEGKKLIYEQNPDVVFLDVNMPKESGFEMLESIAEKNFMVVIVTAHTEYGIQAIKANAIDYLLKPISIAELKAAVKKMITYKNSRSGKSNPINYDKLVIQHFQGYSIIDRKCISRLEANSNYTNIYLCDEKTITASKTLKEFEDLLTGDGFIRVHRSEIININFLKEYYTCDGGYAVMKDGSKVQVSKGKAQELLEAIKNHTN